MSMPDTDLSNGKNNMPDGDKHGEIVISKRYPGNRYVRLHSNITDKGQTIVKEQEEPIELSSEKFQRESRSFLHRSRVTILGKPIATERAIHELIGRFKALAVLSSDALSSVAYGTEASLGVLIAAGTASLFYNLFIGASIVILLAIVAFSYRQTIFHYPNGGGSYIVAKENLNIHFGLVAAAALLIDYILTVSVSISSGVDALTSAFPSLTPISVEIGIVMIGLMLVVNLRGVRESGTIFAAPTYLFVGSFMLMILVGIIQALFHGGLLHPLPIGHTAFKMGEHVSAFLILTAFASGCSAMTGTEAISNGVPIFREPQAKNAAQTLTIMALLLGIMFSGTTYLAWRYGIAPQVNQQPTVTSQLASIFFTGWFGWFYYLFQFATTLILVLAANTSFADFPRLSSILARDHFLPHLFSMQGDRLAFNTGIIVLGVLSAILLAIFKGNTDALINLYALGVFTAFTLSQSGMMRRWLRTKEPGWPRGLAINTLGAVATAIVTVIIAIAKFDRGAWIVVILIPILYAMFQGIHHHYKQKQEASTKIPVRRPGAIRHLVVVPVARIDNLALRGLSYARSLSPYVIALYVTMTPRGAERVRAEWQTKVLDTHFLRGGPSGAVLDIDEQDQPISDPLIGTISGPELVVVNSPYRALSRPVLHFVDALRQAHPDDIITVVLPEFVVTHPWEVFLHNQTVLLLKLGLLTRSDIVTTNVPYKLPKIGDGEAAESEDRGAIDS